MANLFDPDEAREGEPTTIVVGDYIQWKRTDLVSDYPLASYSAEYVARITAGGASEITLPATETDGTYLFSVDSATSAAFTVGYYYWQLEVTKTATGDRVVVDRGTFTAVADLDVNGADPRTHAKIMLDKIESLLEGRADSDVGNYSVGAGSTSRSLTKLTVKELMEWRSFYRNEVSAEADAFNRSHGRATQNTIQARFV